MKKLNKKEIKLIFFVLVPVFIAGVVLALLLVRNDFVSYQCARTVFELKENAQLSDLFELTDKHATMKTEDSRLDTDSVGAKTVTIEFEKLGGHVVSVDFSYKVQDTIAPSLRVKDMTIIIGTEFEPLTAIDGCVDHSEVFLSYGGEYDINTPGEYLLSVTATDAYGNRTSGDYTLTVVDSEVVDGVTRNYFRTSKGFLGYTDSEGFTYIEGCLIVNKTYSFPASYKAEYATLGVVHDLEYLDPIVVKAFKEMRAAMSAEGLTLWMQSGIRVYDIQKVLYNSYVQNLGKSEADKRSARPGHSEHETGLCFDVNTISSFETQYPKECAWLMEHAWEYGFCLRYPNGKTNETGYKYEPWHYRYVGRDLAQKLWNNGDWLTIEDYFGITSVYAD